jgi:hypothetical protein
MSVTMKPMSIQARSASLSPSLSSTSCAETLSTM